MTEYKSLGSEELRREMRTAHIAVARISIEETLRLLTAHDYDEELDAVRCHLVKAQSALGMLLPRA